MTLKAIVIIAFLLSLGGGLLCAQPAASLPEAAAEVSLQLSPDGGLEVKAPAYIGRVGADGNLHSLQTGATEMLDDKTSFSLGAFFFSEQPERLGLVTLPAPAVVQATDGTYLAHYRFLPGEIRISLSHTAQKNATFYMVLSEEVTVAANARTGELAAVPAEERWPDVTFTATSGAFMTVRGGDRIWGPWAKRQMLEIGPLPAGQTREISISFGQGPPPSPTPGQLITLQAEALDNRQVLGFGRPAQLTVSVENRGAAIPDALLSVKIERGQGKTVSELAQQVSVMAKRQIESRFDIALPEPGIYTAQLRLLSAGRVLKEAQVPFVFMPEQIIATPTAPPDFLLERSRA